MGPWGRIGSYLGQGTFIGEDALECHRLWLPRPGPSMGPSEVTHSPRTLRAQQVRNSKYSSLKYWNVSGKGQNDIGHYGNQSNLPGSVRFTASQATINAMNAAQSNRQPTRLSPGTRSTDLKQYAASNTGCSSPSSSFNRRHAPENNLVVRSQQLKKD